MGYIFWILIFLSNIFESLGDENIERLSRSYVNISVHGILIHIVGVVYVEKPAS